MSGGKGGSSTSEVTIPAYIEAAAQRNLNKAERISQLGYVPEYGPTVAAFTPMQQAGFQNTANLAGAYGMGAPASQQDIMGGMGAPTTYANGVQGYSSAPLYDAMVAELAAKRPGQKAYIDSFFIDPVTGGNVAGNYAPIDYFNYPTNAAIAASSGGSMPAGTSGSQAYYDQNVNVIQDAIGDPTYNPKTDVLTASQREAVSKSPSAQLAQDAIYMNIKGNANNSVIDSVRSSPVGRVTGTSPSFSKPLSTGSYGGSLVTGGPSQSSSDYFASATKNTSSKKVDLPGNVVTRALNIGAGKKDSSSSSGYAGKNDDGTVMCTAYCEMGYLPKAIWALDRRYGVKMYREDPTLIEGYHMWGVPVANYLRKQTLGAKVLRAVMWPIVKAWAEEMAHNMKPEEYAPNYFGKLIKFVGEPFSRLCGKLKPRSIEGAV